jgi:ribonuclease HI
MTSCSEILMDKWNEIAQIFSIDHWDIIMVGDGSGNQWDGAVGWSCLMADRLREEEATLVGAENAGTINAVELMPYLWGLRFHYNHWYAGNLPSVMQVHIISDSQVTVNCGNGTYKRQANADLWCTVRYWETQGYVFNWHWTKGHCDDEPDLHRVADQLAYQARQKMSLDPST